MKKIVIAGSVKLQKQIDKWIKTFKADNFKILDHPKPIDKNEFTTQYPKIYKDFFNNITKADTLFIMNENKNNIEGYIGAETFAELSFGVIRKLLYQQKINIVLLKKPSKEVQSFEEIDLWLKLGWIELYKNWSLTK